MSLAHSDQKILKERNIDLVQGCSFWCNWFKLLSFSERLIQPYLEAIHRTRTGLLEVQDFLRVKLDDLWLLVQKSSTSFCQRLGRCWHPARAATGCKQNGGNLNQLCHKLQPCLLQGCKMSWKVRGRQKLTLILSKIYSFNYIILCRFVLLSSWSIVCHVQVCVKIKETF